MAASSRSTSTASSVLLQTLCSAAITLSIWEMTFSWAISSAGVRSTPLSISSRSERTVSAAFSTCSRSSEVSSAASIPVSMSCTVLPTAAEVLFMVLCASLMVMAEAANRLLAPSITFCRERNTSAI